MKIGKLTIRSWRSYNWPIFNLEPYFKRDKDGWFFLVSCFEIIWSDNTNA